MEEPGRILEFYSGIGGMVLTASCRIYLGCSLLRWGLLGFLLSLSHRMISRYDTDIGSLSYLYIYMYPQRYSLMRAGIRGEVVEAFDINDKANDVYEHNFGHRPFQGNIQTLTAIALDKCGAHAWLLSPPCQPYTRQGLQKGSADARAFSFIKILELIPHMQHPPLLLFVENVVGFETSNTHEQMIEVLTRVGFVTQEYILSPLQFKVPYSRPRYYCLAKRKPLSFQHPSCNNQLLWTPPSPLMSSNTIPKYRQGQEEFDIFCEPIRNYLETQTSYNPQPEYAGVSFCLKCNVSTVNCEKNIGDPLINSGAPQNIQITNILTDDIVEEVEGAWEDKIALDKYAVPVSSIERWGDAMDIVYPDSKRCCCFTKSYYRYVKGTGSLLATSEVANLHSFPVDFDFPPHISLRQQYALLGNSLSVAVVAPLLQYLFTEPT